MSRSVLSQMITLANEISGRLTGCRATGPVADRWTMLLVATASRQNRWYLGVRMWDSYSCSHLQSPFHLARLHLSGKVHRKRRGALSWERTRAARSYWWFHPFVVFRGFSRPCYSSLLVSLYSGQMSAGMRRWTKDGGIDDKIFDVPSLRQPWKPVCFMLP